MSSNEDNDRKPPGRRKKYKNPYQTKIPFSHHVSHNDDEFKPRPFARMSTSGKAPSKFVSAATLLANSDDSECRKPSFKKASKASKAPLYAHSDGKKKGFDPYHPTLPGKDGYVLPDPRAEYQESFMKKRRSTLKSIRPESKMLDPGSCYYHAPVIEAAENPPYQAPSIPGSEQDSQPTPPPPFDVVTDNLPPPIGLDPPSVDEAAAKAILASEEASEDEFPIDDFIRLADSMLTLSERCTQIIKLLYKRDVKLLLVVQRYYFGVNQPLKERGQQLDWIFEDHMLGQPLYWLAQSGYPFPRAGDDFAMCGFYIHFDRFINQLHMIHYAITLEYSWFMLVGAGFGWDLNEYAKRYEHFKNGHPFDGWMTKRMGKPDIYRIGKPDINIQYLHDAGGSDRQPSQLPLGKAYVPLTIKTGDTTMDFGTGGSTPKVDKPKKRAPPDTTESGSTYDTPLVITDSAELPVSSPAPAAAARPAAYGFDYGTPVDLCSDDDDRKPAAKKNGPATKNGPAASDGSPSSLSSMSARDSPPTRELKSKAHCSQPSQLQESHDNEDGVEDDNSDDDGDNDEEDEEEEDEEEEDDEEEDDEEEEEDKEEEEADDEDGGASSAGTSVTSLTY
ncbi:unknown protein [Seminavis robusta]|uniref:Uncharacterized protein n=1 Tax=Seminavis robusta TaxID=568900 RepID=A0A9N8EJS9_9STRA|nr:unknown protein [Seminavis robusta]|eukprot:Sro1322_g262610.1 n/a (617) ;mRNA; r:21260-23204